MTWCRPPGECRCKRLEGNARMKGTMETVSGDQTIRTNRIPGRKEFYGSSSYERLLIRGFRKIHAKC